MTNGDDFAGYFETVAEKSGRSIESMDACVIDDETASDLADAIDALEAVDWNTVPGVTTPTAAVFTRMLRQAIEMAENQ